MTRIELLAFDPAAQSRASGFDPGSNAFPVIDDGALAVLALLGVFVAPAHRISRQVPTRPTVGFCPRLTLTYRSG